jgi:DNA-binding beta-propeller fold protein YncE
MTSFKTKAAVVISGIIFLFSCQKELDSPGPQTRKMPDTQKINVYFVSTYAGSSLPGSLDGPAKEATFKAPFGITAAEDGTLYITDNGNNNIRKISPNGIVETLTPAGSLHGPSGIIMCTDGNLYACESQMNRIVKISPSGKISPLKFFELCQDGGHIQTTFSSPNGIFIAPDGTIYVADTFNNKIKKINPSGLVEVLAGSTAGYMDGKCSEAKFHWPYGITMDKDGSLYVSDYWNNTIRKISTAGVVSTIAGSINPGNDDAKVGTDARFRGPAGLAIADDGTIYIADNNNSRIRSILTTGEVTTIAGTDAGFLDGVGITAKFYNPAFLVIHKNVLYITDSNNYRIRKIILD